MVTGETVLKRVAAFLWAVVLVAVNKMGLVGYDRTVFQRIVAEYTDFFSKLSMPDLAFIHPSRPPLGDNVVQRSKRMPWYDRPSLLHHMEYLMWAPVVTWVSAEDAAEAILTELIARGVISSGQLLACDPPLPRVELSTMISQAQ